MKRTTSYTFFLRVLVSQLCSVVLFQCIFIIREQCEEFNSRSVPCNPGLHRCISCSAAHYPKRDSNNHSKQVVYEHVNSHDMVFTYCFYIGKRGKTVVLLFNSHQWHVTILEYMIVTSVKSYITFVQCFCGEKNGHRCSGGPAGHWWWHFRC